MFQIEDGREHFFQWDMDRRLIVKDATIAEVHFCNRTGECSLVCETYKENGKTLVDVPNIILQSDWKVHIYAFDSKHTKYEDSYEVKSRTKPADYVYTETEIRSWDKIEEQIGDIDSAMDRILEIQNALIGGETE